MSIVGKLGDDAEKMMMIKRPSTFTPRRTHKEKTKKHLQS